jgi:hypothetical protein
MLPDAISVPDALGEFIRTVLEQTRTQKNRGNAEEEIL